MRKIKNLSRIYSTIQPKVKWFSNKNESHFVEMVRCMLRDRQMGGSIQDSSVRAKHDWQPSQPGKVPIWSYDEDKARFGLHASVWLYVFCTRSERKKNCETILQNSINIRICIVTYQEDPKWQLFVKVPEVKYLMHVTNTLTKDMHYLTFSLWMKMDQWMSTAS